jgi:hypothetical protein
LVEKIYLIYLIFYNKDHSLLNNGDENIFFCILTLWFLEIGGPSDLEIVLPKIEFEFFWIICYLVKFINHLNSNYGGENFDNMVIKKGRMLTFVKKYFLKLLHFNFQTLKKKFDL